MLKVIKYSANVKTEYINVCIKQFKLFKQEFMNKIKRERTTVNLELQELFTKLENMQ